MAVTAPTGITHAPTPDRRDRNTSTTRAVGTTGPGIGSTRRPRRAAGPSIRDGCERIDARPTDASRTAGAAAADRRPAVAAAIRADGADEDPSCRRQHSQKPASIANIRLRALSRLVCSQDIDDLSGPAGADLRTDDWELAGFAAADAVLAGSPAASVTAVCSDTDERHWLQPRTREAA